jgi:four helix bundle protein
VLMVKRFEDLEVWRKAEDLAVAVYSACGMPPFARDFALRDQIRRASISVMSNIAEGFERYSRAEFRHFLSIARGSAAEVRLSFTLLADSNTSNQRLTETSKVVV